MRQELVPVPLKQRRAQACSLPAACVAQPRVRHRRAWLEQPYFAFLAAFSAFFSFGVFSGCFLVSFFLSSPFDIALSSSG